MQVATPTDASVAPVSFVDDDQIASYFFSEVPGSAYVHNIRHSGPENERVNDQNSPIDGPAGSRLTFKLKASSQATNSTYLFTKFGSSGYEIVAGSGTTYHYIDTTLRITGFTTGYRVDIPIRLVKKQ